MLQLSILGNLTRNAERKRFGDKSFISMSVAASSSYNKNDAPVYVDVTYFSKSDKLEPYLRKGTKVLVSGNMSVNEFIRKDGSKGYGVKVVANNLNLVGGQQQKQNSQYV